MIIESLYMENFRHYKGPITINFSVDPEKKFTIIKGTNGAGKTTILNAITWCIYGKELHGSDDSEDIHNEIAENELNEFEELEVKVKIVFLDEKNNKKIQFIRSFKVTKGLKGSILKGDEHFTILFPVSGDNKPLKRPDLFVKREFPKRLEPYFFFDGEKLEDYFDSNSFEDINGAVLNISQLNLFKKVYSHLNDRESHFASKISSLDEDEGNYTEEKIKFENQIHSLTNQKEGCESKLKSLLANKKEYQKELNAIDNKDKDEIESQIRRTNKDISFFEKKIEEIKTNKKEYIFEMFPLILTNNELNNTLNLGKDLEEYIPADIREKFLKKILDKKVCICGNDLSKDKVGYDKVKNFHDSLPEETNISEVIHTELEDIKKIKSKIPNFNLKRESFNEEIKEFNVKLKEANEDLEYYEDMYSNIKHEDIQRLRDKILELTDEESKKNRKIGSLSAQITNAKNKLESLEKKHNRIKVNNDKIARYQNYVNLCSKAKEVSESIKTELANRIHEKLVEYTKNNFLDLNWKSFVDVSIDSNYSVKVTKRSGRIVSPKSLSAGERLALALSFVSALHNISGFDLPIIIDTPMGRLDKEIKLNSSDAFKKYLGGKQVTLIVTGEEYTTAFRSGIIDAVGKEYIIKPIETDLGEEAVVELVE